MIVYDLEWAARQILEETWAWVDRSNYKGSPVMTALNIFVSNGQFEKMWTKILVGTCKLSHHV